MILQHLNYLHILVAAIAYFLVGGIWFNSKVFGTIWMKGHGLPAPTDEQRKQMGLMMGKTYLMTYIATIALDCLVVKIDAHTWMTGVHIGLVAGIFACMSIAMSHMYTRKPTKLIILDTAYHFCGLIIAAIILSVWR